MKKEVTDILQNEVVFDRLSGSAGNITAVSMGDKHYFRKKGKTECPNTERQQTHHQVTARGVAAWQSLDMDKQEQWNRLGEQVRPHSFPFNDGSRLSVYNLFISCYLQLASTGRESIPEPGSSPVSVPDLSLELAEISESDSSTLNIECKATPAIPDGFCIIARIKVHAYGYDCNPGYKLSRCGKSDDGCHVTFTLQDYRRSFNIGTLERREVFVRMEYDLVDMQSGFHRTNKKVLRTKLMLKNNTISERFE